ncbi:MAG: hypothetical protein WAW06_09835 [bacterium]
MAQAEVKQDRVNRTHLVLVLLVAVLMLSITRGRLIASMVPGHGQAGCPVEDCAAPPR